MDKLLRKTDELSAKPCLNFKKTYPMHTCKQILLFRYLPELGMKKGLKIFGNAGINAMLKELQQQLHDRKVMEPKGLKDISNVL
jgi:hypothetical protein